MKTRIVLLIVITSLFVLTTGCFSNREVLISPEQLEELESLQDFKCQTNLSIFFYKKYRVDNKKTGDHFYLNKDGKLLFIKGPIPKNGFGKIRDKEAKNEAICKFKESFQEDMSLVKNRSRVQEIMDDLALLDSTLVRNILSGPLIDFDNFSGKVCGDLVVSIYPSIVYCYYQIGEVRTYISFDKSGKLIDFYFANVNSGSIESFADLHYWTKEYTENKKQYYYYSAETSTLIYINEEGSATWAHVNCLSFKEIENLRWKIESILMSIKMDLILQDQD